MRVVINGLGRIGRGVLKAGFGSGLEFAAINHLGDPEAAAHLLKYDSTHGIWDKDIKAHKDALVIDGVRIPLVSHRDPEYLPWKDLGVDLVFECTGAFKEARDLKKHLKSGAKKVIVSAPAPGADKTIVFGVNEKTYDPKSDFILSNASCTTNCLAPVVKVLHEKFKVSKGFVTTVHAFTADQNLVDSGHKDLRRARGATQSMIPTTTGAAKAVGKVLPSLEGKIDGVAIRIPTPNVSLVDLVVVVENKVSVESVNRALEEAAKGQLSGILDFNMSPLVSCDYNGNPHSSIVDGLSTMTVGDNMVKVFSWYDNEMGFCYRMIDLAEYINSF